MGDQVPEYIKSVKDTKSVPDLSSGACMTEKGRRVMDRGNASTSGARESRYVKAAKALCATCTVEKACDEWVTRAETKPGQWGNIYAGRTARERAKGAK